MCIYGGMWVEEGGGDMKRLVFVSIDAPICAIKRGLDPLS
jgi:hypothetical protein